MTFYTRASNSLDVEQRVLMCLSTDTLLMRDEFFQSYIRKLLSMGTLDSKKQTYRVTINVEPEDQ